MNVRLSLVPVIFSMVVFLGSRSPSFGAEPVAPVQLRQKIIRVPEEVVLQALEKKPDDDALAKQILQWVESGQAKVVSELTVPANPKVRFEAKDGKVYKWVTENDQEFFGGPVLTPTSWEDVFLGIKLEGENGTEAWQEIPTPKPKEGAPADPFAPKTEPKKKIVVDPFGPVTIDPEEIPGGMHALKFNFAMETRSQMASKIKWPLVWPENKKPQVGIYEQDDFLVQNLITTALLQPGRENVVAFLPTATDLETEPAPRMLDVVLMHSGSAKSASPADTNFPTAPRVHLLGFGLNDRDALELLATRDPNNDAALLAKVQALAREGKAVRRLALGTQTPTGVRSTIASVREHSYPTEMPTIPSAWEMRPVGTRVELDMVDRSTSVAFEHHPARFRWAEWACALDAPELIMRQPQFFVQRVDTSIDFPSDNVVLVAGMRTPECLKGSDKGPVIGETLLLFAELNQPAGTPPLTPWPANDPPRFPSLEAMVFELPASEREEWKGTNTPEPVDDELRFQKVMKRVKEGTAKLVCHLMMATRSGQRTGLKMGEEVLYVTEYNPVDHNPTGRYRPTALTGQLVGSTWEVDVQISDANEGGTAPIIYINHSLRHDALPAVQPTLKEAMKYTQDHPHDLPPPTFTTDEWMGNGVNLYSGKARCLGPVQPKGARFQNRIHVAFVRGTVRK